MKHTKITIDGNEAAANIGYRANEVIAIYPITPASPMGELADAWNAQGLTNVWGQVPQVIEMQSEAGVAGAIHGALQCGSLCTTFTSSQGLLLMIPNMFKIAGELTPMVLHVASRVAGTFGLSIFVEHNDVMATRATGFGILFSDSVQMVHDFALIAQAASLESRVPVLHAFDGFRTSHETDKIDLISDEHIREMLRPEWIQAHRERALSPERPVLRGTVQNIDVFFQGRERQNPFFYAAPDKFQANMDRFAELTGRQYHLFDYAGAPDAERVIVLMGSASETAEETVNHLVKQGEKVGVVKVHLFRPFSVAHFLKALPPTVKVIGVLDRCREQGSAGEPLYLDVATAVTEGMLSGEAPFRELPNLVPGRYGIGGKEFTPAMVKAIFDNLAQPEPKKRFVVGIEDDVNFASLPYDPSYDIEPDDVVRCVFWGLGADGTVSANKNSIKIIGETTDNYCQAYFLYDSKKSGSITESHLRFGPRPIQSTYLISRATFTGIHQFGIMDVRPVLDRSMPNSTVLINSPYDDRETWDRMPRRVQEQILEKNLQVYLIDAHALAHEVGLGGRISAIMQTGFFLLSGILPREEALVKIREAVQHAYAKRGRKVVEQNLRAIDMTVNAIRRMEIPGEVTSTKVYVNPIPDTAPPMVRQLIGPMIAGEGEKLPVSAMSVDGTFPTSTTKYEKRNISVEAPVWNPQICTQCGNCVFVCPHAVIRAKVVPAEALAGVPEGFKSAPAKWREFSDWYYTLQVSADDCTGCGLCVEACPAKDKAAVGRRAINLEKRTEPREVENERWNAFLRLPDLSVHDAPIKFRTVKNVQLLRPYFEFPGACTGCGESPYIRLASQLFGDRMLIAAAAGCAAVYLGNHPTTSLTYDEEGRGPTYNCSLFEDNAEFGFGYRVSLDQQMTRAKLLLDKLRAEVGEELAEELLRVEPEEDPRHGARRRAVARLRERLQTIDRPEARELMNLAEHLVERSVWIIGGDGWAYDIGFGGVDHVIAQGLNVNMLVLDTEVYSNTGGQKSKATSRGAVVKFAAGGQPGRKKDLGRMMIGYGNAYVAQVAMGADYAQTLRAFIEAESYRGPSLIVAYSHCIAHGIDMRKGMEQQTLAVKSGHWPLYRYDPRRIAKGLNPFQLDSDPPSVPLEEYLYNENRYAILLQTQPERAKMLLEKAKHDVEERWRAYQALAAS